MRVFLGTFDAYGFIGIVNHLPGMKKALRALLQRLPQYYFTMSKYPKTDIGGHFIDFFLREQPSIVFSCLSDNLKQSFIQIDAFSPYAF